MALEQCNDTIVRFSVYRINPGLVVGWWFGRNMRPLSPFPVTTVFLQLYRLSLSPSPTQSRCPGCVIASVAKLSPNYQLLCALLLSTLPLHHTHTQPKFYAPARFPTTPSRLQLRAAKGPSSFYILIPYRGSGTTRKICHPSP